MATVTMTLCRRNFEQLFESALAGEIHEITKYGKTVAYMAAPDALRRRFNSKVDSKIMMHRKNAPSKKRKK